MLIVGAVGDQLALANELTLDDACHCTGWSRIETCPPPGRYSMLARELTLAEAFLYALSYSERISISFLFGDHQNLRV